MATLPTSGSITANDIQGEFGQTQGGSFRLQDYYRGGDNVPNTPARVARAEVQQIPFSTTGTANTVSGGTDEVISLTLDDRFNSGPAADTTNAQFSGTQTSSGGTKSSGSITGTTSASLSVNFSTAFTGEFNMALIVRGITNRSGINVVLTNVEVTPGSGSHTISSVATGVFLDSGVYVTSRQVSLTNATGNWTFSVELLGTLNSAFSYSSLQLVGSREPTGSSTFPIYFENGPSAYNFDIDTSDVDSGSASGIEISTANDASLNALGIVTSSAQSGVSSLNFSTPSSSEMYLEIRGSTISVLPDGRYLSNVITVVTDRFTLSNIRPVGADGSVGSRITTVPATTETSTVDITAYPSSIPVSTVFAGNVFGTLAANANASTALSTIGTAVTAAFSGVTAGSVQSTTGFTDSAITLDFTGMTYAVPADFESSSLLDVFIHSNNFTTINLGSGVFNALDAFAGMTMSSSDLATLVANNIDSPMVGTVSGNLVYISGVSVTDPSVSTTATLSYLDFEAATTNISSPSATLGVPARSIELDTNQTTDLSQMLTWTMNDGNGFAPVVTQVSSGAPATTASNTSFVISSYDGAEISSGTLGSQSDIETFVTTVTNAIDNNTEEPIDFRVSGRSMNIASGMDGLNVVAQETGPVTGTISVTVTHGDGDGTISFGTTTVTTEGQDAHAGTQSIPTSGGITFSDFYGAQGGS